MCVCKRWLENECKLPAAAQVATSQDHSIHTSTMRAHSAITLLLLPPSAPHQASCSCASASPFAAAAYRWNMPPSRAASGSSSGLSSGRVTVSA